MEKSQVNELLYQALETEMGGIKVYRTAVRCAQNPELKEEWEKYLEQTENHERSCARSSRPSASTPRRRRPDAQIVRHKGEALVAAMEMALTAGDPAAAEIVAAECVVDAETKDHHNWELIGKVAEKLKGEEGKALKDAYDEVEDEEDEHLYHTTGWAPGALDRSRSACRRCCRRPRKRRT